VCHDKYNKKDFKSKRGKKFIKNIAGSPVKLQKCKISYCSLNIYDKDLKDKLVNRIAAMF
jgi:hypothetical protein